MTGSLSAFDTILQRAAERKGGGDNLRSLLPAPALNEQLAATADSYFLEEMTRSIFQSGFVWKVINNKWPSFQQALFDFDLTRLMKLGDRDWEGYLQDRRIVRHRQKIQALRHNIWFVNEISAQHAGFGRFLADWPKSDLVGLFGFLKTKGSRLGGNTGQYFLQHVGVDSFALTRDVVMALQMSGVSIRDNPTSKRDLTRVQQAFNQWHESDGYGYLQMSHILAYSVGENRVGIAI